MIHTASPMILCHSGDIGGMKEGKIVVSSQGELALLKPPADRHVEPLLGAIENLRWQNRLHRLLQEILRLAIPIFIGVGYFPDKIDEFDIEERSPHLQGIHHAGAIGLDKDIILKIKLCVELQGLVYRVLLFARIPLLNRLGIDLLNVVGSRKSSSISRGSSGPSQMAFHRCLG